MARRTEDRDFLTIYDWMISSDGLGLKVTSAACTVYARIYAVSHHGQGASFETQGHLAQLLGMSREAVCRSVRLLKDRGLIEERATIGPERTGLKLLAVVQEPIDRAIECCDAAYDDEARDALRAATVPVKEPEHFSQPPCDSRSRACDRKSQGGESEVPPCDRESHLVIENHKGVSCGLFKTSEFSTEPSTSGNREEGQVNGMIPLAVSSSKEDLEDMRRNKNIFIYKYDIPSQGDYRLGIEVDNPQVDTVRVPAPQLRDFEIFIESSPKRVGEEHIAETARAWMRAVDAGFEPSQILRAWRRYLDWFLSPLRPEQTRALRFLMWPKSFLEREAGLARWAHADGAGHEPPSASKPLRGGDGGGEHGRMVVGRNGRERWWIHVGPEGMTQVCPVSAAADEADAWAIMERRAMPISKMDENTHETDQDSEYGECARDVDQVGCGDGEEAKKSILEPLNEKSPVATHNNVAMAAVANPLQARERSRDPPVALLEPERGRA